MHHPLAAMPLVLGAQQAIEGGLWLTLPVAPHGALTAALTLGYLVIAGALWPVYAPHAAGLVEPHPPRRRLIALCLALGVGVGAYMLWAILTGPRDVAIVGRCIAYGVGERHSVPVALAYLAATALPLILSSRRAIRLLGVIALVGFAVSVAFYVRAFLSVWCFFAAVASVVILAHFTASRGRAEG